MNKYCGSKQNIKVIILTGGRDFGRCRLASGLPPALWPIAGTPALELLLQQLSGQNIRQAVICSNGDASLLRRSIENVSSMQLKFLEEPLPAGTAGCIRDAAKGDAEGDGEGDADSLFLVFHGARASLPDIKTLIRSHRTSDSVLTVVLQNNGAGVRMAGIYVCEPAVLAYS